MRSLRGLLFVALILFYSISGYAQPMPGNAVGGQMNDAAFALCNAPDGGFALAGLTRSEGAGSTDLYVVKLDAAGCMQWSRTYGIDVQEQAFWIEPTLDGGYFVTGYCYVCPGGKGRQDFFLLKLDSRGELVWQKMYGSYLLDVGLCGKPLSGGGYAALGISREGDTRGNYYFTKLTAEGSRAWYKIYDSPWVDYGHEFLELEDGGFLLYGTESGFLFPSELDHAKSNADLMLIRVDDEGNEVWRRIYGGKRHDLGKAIRKAPDGGYYLFGSTQNEGAGSFDMYLLKVDDNGDPQWSRTYGFPGWDYGQSMDLSSDGHLFLLGTRGVAGALGKPDMYLVKAKADGEPVWSLEIGGDSSDYGMMVRSMPGGGCALTGSTKSIGSGGNDAYFIMISADGIPVSATSFQDRNNFPVVVPNPVTDVSTIRVPPDMECDQVEWRAFDSQGRLVQTLNFSSGERPTLDASQLGKGMYFYELVERGKMVLKGKFVVY